MMHISSRRRRVPCAAEQLSSLMHECAGVAGFDRPWSTHRLSSLKLSRWRARRSSRLGRGLTSSALASSESMDSCCRATCDRREGDGWLANVTGRSQFYLRAGPRRRACGGVPAMSASRSLSMATLRQTKFCTKAIDCEALPIHGQLRAPAGGRFRRRPTCSVSVL